MMQKLRKSLIKHEGYEKHLYTDSLGNTTIGIGFNIGERGLSDAQIDTQYLSDVVYFYTQLSTFDWFQQLTPDRQIVLIDMAFMGWKKFLTFDKMISAIEQANYEDAAEEMLNSEWAKQVGNRAEELARGMLTGIYNP